MIKRKASLVRWLCPKNLLSTRRPHFPYCVIICFVGLYISIYLSIYIIIYIGAQAARTDVIKHSFNDIYTQINMRWRGYNYITCRFFPDEITVGNDWLQGYPLCCYFCNRADANNSSSGVTLDNPSWQFRFGLTWLSFRRAGMSLLQKMFGSGKKGEPTPQDAIQKLRETEGMLNKKSAFLEQKITEELTKAKQHGTKNKRGKSRNVCVDFSRRLLLEVPHQQVPATLKHSIILPPAPPPRPFPLRRTCSPLPAAALQHLKRKKRLEKQLQNVDGTLSTIEFQREALENAQTNTEVFKNMKTAAQALKSAQQGLWVAFVVLILRSSHPCPI